MSRTAAAAFAGALVLGGATAAAAAPTEDVRLPGQGDAFDFRGYHYESLGGPQAAGVEVSGATFYCDEGVPYAAWKVTNIDTVAHEVPEFSSKVNTIQPGESTVMSDPLETWVDDDWYDLNTERELVVDGQHVGWVFTDTEGTCADFPDFHTFWSDPTFDQGYGSGIYARVGTDGPDVTPDGPDCCGDESPLGGSDDAGTAIGPVVQTGTGPVATSHLDETVLVMIGAAGLAVAGAGVVAARRR